MRRRSRSWRGRRTMGRMSRVACAVGALGALAALTCVPPAPSTPNGNADPPPANDNVTSPQFTKTNPGCLVCHGAIEDVHPIALGCTECHGGDFSTDAKEKAHVLPSQAAINDQTVPPLDHDLPYQQFVNPSNLRVVEQTCGVCHRPHVGWVKKSLMATAAGHHAGGLYQNGVTDSKTPSYSTIAVRDDDGVVPVEAWALESLPDLIEFDPTADPSEFATHYAAVPGQACVRCHLWSRGKGFRGAEGQEGLYRADGCAACHMLYANDGRSTSADATIDHEQQGHPRVHQITRKVTTEQCLHCHHRGARIGLSFTGRSQMPPGLPSGPGVPGTTDVKFNTNYHYADAETNPQDVHHQAGLACIDCHTQAGVMGDGNIYGHMDQATKVECRQCHGMPGQDATLIDHDGKPLWNVTRQADGEVVLTSKVTGAAHAVKQLTDFLDPDSPNYNDRAAAAMTDHHLKDEGGLECYACHASWAPNCFGCHFERDEQLAGLNLITRTEEMGKASTNNKVFVSLKHFAMGPNAEGRMAPYVVGCQPIADVTAPDGSKILDFVMPETVNGKSGLALNPVNPHTTRGPGEVRTCVECHRSPPSLGLGSGNYSLARKKAFVAGSVGVEAFDRNSDPAAPVSLGRFADGGVLALATVPNIIEGTADYLFAASGASGVQIFDMRDGLPTGPIGAIEGIHAIDVSYASRYLYVVVEDVGVRIYDVLDPTSAVFVAEVGVASARRAVPWGIHLFVAAGDAGLVVVNIADHADPVVEGALAGMNAVDVHLYAHHQKGPGFAVRAYVADPDYGVRIVDLLPEFGSPSLAGGLPLPGAAAIDTYTRYLLAEGDTPSREHDYLYVAAGSAGLHVFDITDPDAVVEVAALTDLGGSADHVDVASQMTPPGVTDYALIVGAGIGLRVVDVTDPRQPALVRTVSSTGAGRVFVEVQQLDRFLDEQGNELKENSHPGITPMNRADVVRILGADIGG